MASSLFALIDDIASLMDDVSLMTKTAAKKTTGVLGDDLALNAQQVTGVGAERELPVVWAVAKGSLLNKCILVPAALAISAFIPWAITPLLMVGGTYLCYEGAEKILHSLLHSHDDAAREKRSSPLTPEEEKQKIKGAIRTDFILSAEIIALTLGIVSSAPLVQQLMVLAVISLVITLGVYGLVGAIVKLDDGGLLMTRSANAFTRQLGNAVLAACPWLMKGLSFAGTVAMFVVGGGIITHGIHALAEIFQHWQHAFAERGEFQALLSPALPSVLDAVTGVALGIVALGIVSLIQRLFAARR